MEERTGTSRVRPSSSMLSWGNSEVMQIEPAGVINYTRFVNLLRSLHMEVHEYLNINEYYEIEVIFVAPEKRIYVSWHSDSSTPARVLAPSLQRHNPIQRPGRPELVLLFQRCMVIENPDYTSLCTFSQSLINRFERMCEATLRRSESVPPPQSASPTPIQPTDDSIAELSRIANMLIDRQNLSTTPPPPTAWSAASDEPSIRNDSNVWELDDLNLLRRAREVERDIRASEAPVPIRPREVDGGFVVRVTRDLFEQSTDIPLIHLSCPACRQDFGFYLHEWTDSQRFFNCPICDISMIITTQVQDYGRALYIATSLPESDNTSSPGR